MQLVLLLQEKFLSAISFFCKASLPVSSVTFRLLKLQKDAVPCQNYWVSKDFPGLVFSTEFGVHVVRLLGSSDFVAFLCLMWIPVFLPNLEYY
jgi:hypothetical protein